MAKNENLHRAKATKEDEFYTQRSYIEDELSHYEKHFEGKTVYCNCDDPESSEFWQFFRRVFGVWKIKRLIATHYEPNAKNYAYSLDLSEDTNGDGVIDWNDKPVLTQLPCNGDFRSAACIELLKQADIVVTNPPFSLWREYVQQLIEYDKKFLIIGSQNAITYKEIFPLLMNNQMWLGYYSGDMKFKVPEYYEPRATRFWIDETGQKWRSLGNTCWYTNLDIPKRHQHLDLRGNYYKAEMYHRYDNYDAIDVSKVSDIPCDYSGIMGVPITFLNRYSPSQFEIVGGSQYDDTPCRIIKNYRELGYMFFKADGITVSGSGALRDKTSPKVKHKGNGDFSISPNGEFLSAVYQRIFIRHKNPEPRRYPDED